MTTRNEAQARSNDFLRALQALAEEHGISHYVAIVATEASDENGEGYQMGMGTKGNVAILASMADVAHTKLLRKLADSDCMGAFLVAMAEGETPFQPPKS